MFEAWAVVLFVAALNGSGDMEVVVGATFNDKKVCKAVEARMKEETKTWTEFEDPNFKYTVKCVKMSFSKKGV